MEKSQWQGHVDACKRSGQTKSVYAKQHHLGYHQFLYWFRTLSQTTSPEQFIEVKIKPEIKSVVKISDCLGVLEFPNGARLVIHSADLIPLLPAFLTRHA